MTATKTVSLNDYANERAFVVVFWAGIGQPAGEYTITGHPDLDFADRNGLLDLTGTVDSEDCWQWDGNGKPADDNCNSIRKVRAHVSETVWTEIVNKYLAGD